jgi:N-acetylmuramoyl-L-alanine amidase
MVVLHYTAMASADAALQRLCDPQAEVSAHYLIDRDGTCWQLVAEDVRAWHAGAGAWAGVADVNSNSIGIELVNTGAEPFGLRQFRALEQVLSGILSRWAIAPADVIGHSDMAPDRKQDPGPRFDWRALARSGLAVWSDAFCDGADFDALLTAIGYPDAPTEYRLAAFRARFRPEGHGALCAQDVGRAAAVARMFQRSRANA